MSTATIRDSAIGSSAELLISQGFNCFRFTAVIRGRPVEIIYAPGDFGLGKSRPSSGGIPLLFPFPGRIPGTKFTWEGNTYELEPGDAFGNAIHGFVHARPWRVVEHSESRIVGQFHAWRDDPSIKNRWPGDFRITAMYELAGNTLNAQYLLENPGDRTLPCGFGTHPYFRVPLGETAADDCIVKLPVTSRWELADMLPTGKRLDLANAGAFQAGQRFGDLKLDDAFSGLEFEGPWCSTSIHDPASGATMTQRFDRNFRECVVYTAPHRQAICIEPLTCVPSCFGLEARGIDAGMRILKPGESFDCRVEISLS